MAITNTVFKNPYDQNAEVWTAQGAAIYIGDRNSDPLSGTALTGDGKNKTSNVLGAINGVRIDFGRTVTTKYPLGINDKPIHIVGAPSGTITLNTLIGPTTSLNIFLSKFGDVCQPFSMAISNMDRNKKLGCETSISSQMLKCYGCIGQVLQYDITEAQQGMIMASGVFQIKFTQMTWDLGSGTSGSGNTAGGSGNTAGGSGKTADGSVSGTQTIDTDKLRKDQSTLNSESTHPFKATVPSFTIG